MNPTTRRILIWSPRLLGLAFAGFISLFALDAFGHGKGIWESLGDFGMHLIPTFVLLGIVALAWRWPWVGTAGSLALAALFLYWNFTVRHNVPSAVLVIAGPLFVMAGLFLLSWVKRTELR
jgi:hypothetical protein